MLLDKVFQIIHIGLQESFSQLGLRFLRFQHFRRDAVSGQNLLDQSLQGQNRLRLQHVTPPLFGRNAIHQAVQQVANQPLLICLLQPQFHRHINQQQFFGRVVVQQRRANAHPHAAARTGGNVDLTGQQACLGGRIAPHIYDLFNISRKRLPAVRTGQRWPVPQIHVVLRSFLK